MCGMCLPQCPTYQLYQCETESPRGRLALMQAINQQRIEASAVTLLHIDHCLGCLNCETICPSRVPYGQLLDEFRDQFSSSIDKPLVSRQILAQSIKPNGLEKLASLADMPVLKQLNAFFKTVPQSHVEQLSANGPSELKNFYPSSTPSRGQVSLFTGCSGKATDLATIKDASVLLNRLGFDVSIAEQEYCCGAMHQHNGQQEMAQWLLEKNKAQFNELGSAAILFFSPACGASLELLTDIRIQDIRLFILNELQQHPLPFSTTNQPVALHESCSHRNMLKLKSLNTDLLKYIPGIQILESDQPYLCCGAGGLQSVNYPLQAHSILQQKLRSFDLLNTRVLLSDNIGCSLHIKSAISAYNPDIEILHPVSFLARQLVKLN